MLHNYHTHTFRCHHASGTEREYIERAIEMGLKTLGFSDHAPHYAARDNDYYPHWCMRPELMDEYVTTVRALAKEYAGDIRILCGVEIEYSPESNGENKEFLQQFGLDYMLLGQHVLGSSKAQYFINRTSDEDLGRYVTSVLSALETGDFLYLAHPDLNGVAFSQGAVEREYRRLCEGAKRLGIPLELNLLGLRTGRCYPSTKFFEIAAGVGNEVVLGIDAHSAGEFGEASGVNEGEAMAKRLGLNLREKLL